MAKLGFLNRFFGLGSGNKAGRVWRVVGMVFLLAAVFAGVLLVKSPQDIRERAGGGDGTSEVCNDGVDNNSDGRVDCNDPSCADSASCGACQVDSNCSSSGQKCQNGKCVGSSGGTGSSGTGGGGGYSVSLTRCKTSDQCAEGKACSGQFKICVPKTYCEKYKSLRCK